jgi:hypothetical protein
MTTNQKDITLPPEFSADAQVLLFTRYGDPRENGWEQKWINNWNIQAEFPWFPIAHIQIHKHFQTLLSKAFNELQVTDLYKEITTFDGCFEIRTLKGSNIVLSTHSWGAALDLNASTNHYGSNGTWSEKFIDIMQKNDICCGQKWSGRKDPMHFSMVNG